MCIRDSFRYEEAARLRDRIDALDQVVERLRRLAQLRTLERCLIVPALEPGCEKGFFICGGAICAVRSLPPGAGVGREIDAALALCEAARTSATPPLSPEHAEDLILLDGFVRRPPPELAVLPLEREAIWAHVSRTRTLAA